MRYDGGGSKRTEEFHAALGGHGADQWLHDAAQIVRHVEQAADAGTCRETIRITKNKR